MSVVPLNTQQWRDLNQSLNNFFAGVNFMNRRIIDDSIALVNEFIQSLNQPTQPTPPPPPPVTSPPNPIIPDPTKFLIKFHEFIETLTRNDMQTGGHRHRNYKGTLMHWEVPYKWVLGVPDGRIARYTYTQRWRLDGRAFTKNTRDGFYNKVNIYKIAIGASIILEFGTRNSIEIYFIKTTHT